MNPGQWRVAKLSLDGTRTHRITLKKERNREEEKCDLVIKRNMNDGDDDDDNDKEREAV